jgi:hypothetical protein
MTVRNIHLMLNKALADARRKGTVVRNVAALVGALTEGSTTRQDQGMGCRSARRLPRCDRCATLYAAFHLTAQTGVAHLEPSGRWRRVRPPRGATFELLHVAHGE